MQLRNNGGDITARGRDPVQRDWCLALLLWADGERRQKVRGGCSVDRGRYWARPRCPSTPFFIPLQALGDAKGSWQPHYSLNAPAASGADSLFSSGGAGGGHSAGPKMLVQRHPLSPLPQCTLALEEGQWDWKTESCFVSLVVEVRTVLTPTSNTFSPFLFFFITSSPKMEPPLSL